MQAGPVLEKMVVLVLMMVIGFGGAKCGVTGPEFNRRVTPVVMNIFLVGTILNAVFAVDEFVSGVVLAQYFGVMVLMFALSIAIAWIMTALLRVEESERGLFRLLVFLSNNVFIGFPVVEAMYGASAVFYASISNIPFNLILYTLGVAQLQQGERFRWRAILTPPLIATLLAAALYLLQVRVPHVIADLAGTLSGATVPVSMMLIGTSLGAAPIGRALKNPRVWFASLLRLIVVPVAVWAVLRLLTNDPMMLGIPVIIAACPSAMVIAVLCLRYGRDDSFAAQVIFVSTALSAVTMPLLLQWLL